MPRPFCFAQSRGPGAKSARVSPRQLENSHSHPADWISANASSRRGRRQGRKHIRWHIKAKHIAKTITRDGSTSH
eukprot:7283958-Pyramimonas_sp.AAC.1